MKGIILAGGIGSRLFPVTKGVSKQLLPVYDKPMVYYPLSVLMQAEIKDILLISTPHDLDQYKRLLGNGDNWGINLNYAKQENPNGLAEAFIIGESFIKNDPVCLVLGDNIFHGSNLVNHLKTAIHKTNTKQEATIFGVRVKDPQRYGVVTYDNKGNPIEIIEKPEVPKSDYAVAGLYFYPNSVIKIAKTIKPSERGELEITSVNQTYLNEENLYLEKLGKGFTWLDTGTHESLLEASQFIQTIEKRQGIKVGCLEEIAFENGWISKENIIKSAKVFKYTGYGDYLLKKYSKDED
jgi:glucose-1-phosphate thymidylyltransferase